MKWIYHDHYNVWATEDEKYMIVQIRPNPASTTQFYPYYVLRYWVRPNLPMYDEIDCQEYTLEYIKEHAEQLVVEHFL